MEQAIMNREKALDLISDAFEDNAFIGHIDAADAFVEWLYQKGYEIIRAHDPNWIEKSVTFARIRAQLLQIFTVTNRPLDLTEISELFKTTFHYLPNIERRLRDMVEQKMIKKNPGRIPTWEKEA